MKKDLKKILIVDDESNTRQALVRYFRGAFDVSEAENGEVAINLLKQNDYDVVLTDLRMPGADGIGVLEATLSKADSPKCIVLTAYGSVEKAVEAVKKGAFDFLTKPLKLDKLETVINSALAAKEKEKTELVQAIATAPKSDIAVIKPAKIFNQNIVFHSSSMQQVYRQVAMVAPTKSTVLITGESGTGKEVVANVLHKLSQRTGLFVAVHSAALSDNLLESELFGHEKGAFTGATEMRKGRFELADGGTLFLDEIGEISLATQVKLLRVLETKSFERVGGNELIQTDVRLIAATNRNLWEMVQNGEFREDLYYRLNVVNLELPPLRKRPEDIEDLVNGFLAHFAFENGLAIPHLSSEAMAQLKRYNFPGNVRELKNCVERLVIFNQNKSEIIFDDLPDNIRNYRTKDDDIDIIDTDVIDVDLNIELSEKELILKALDECGNNRTCAAAKLGISRRTLQRRLKEYGIN